MTGPRKRASSAGIRWHFGLTDECADGHDIRNLYGEQIWEHGGFRSVCDRCATRWLGLNGTGTVYAHPHVLADPGMYLIAAVTVASTTGAVLGSTTGALWWRILVATVATSALLAGLAAALTRMRRYSANARTSAMWRFTLPIYSMVVFGVFVRALVWPAPGTSVGPEVWVWAAKAMVMTLVGICATGVICALVDRYVPINRSAADDVRTQLTRMRDTNESTDE